MRRIIAEVIGLLVGGMLLGCSNLPVRDSGFDGPIPPDAIHVRVASQHLPVLSATQDSFFVRIELGIDEAELDSAGLVGPREEFLPLSGKGRSWGARFGGRALGDPALLHAEDYGLRLSGWDARGNVYALGPVMLHHVFRTLPVPTTPAPGAREPLRPTFTWEPLPDDPAVQFHYIIAYTRMLGEFGHLDDAAVNAQSILIPSDSTSYQPHDALIEGTYSWILCAVDAYGDSVCSPPVQFEVEATF
jgi:hypothetical protein